MIVDYGYSVKISSNQLINSTHLDIPSVLLFGCCPEEGATY